jgi:hypothetical protein
MAELPPGFRVVEPAAKKAALPPGFRVVAPQQEPPKERDRGIFGLPLMTEGVDRNPFADAIGALNEAGGVTPEQEASGEWRRGALAPVIRNEKSGELRPAWPQIGLDIASAFTLPGDLLAEKEGLIQPQPGSTSALSDEAVGRGTIASMVFAGGNTPAARRVALSETPRVAAKDVARNAGMTRPAAETLVRALGADDALTPEGMTAFRQNAAPDGMLADAGPATAAVLDTAIQRSGPGATAARRAIERRAANASTTVNTALDEALGVPQGVKATETAIRKGSAGARQAAYDGPNGAYAAPIDYSAPAGRQVETLLQRVPEGVIGLANKLMQVDGHQSAQIMAKIADDGSVTFVRPPDVRQLDYITRALNTAAKSGEGQGALGGQTDIGRAYGNLAREIRDTVRGAVPEYDRALNTAATPIQAREALRFGEGMLGPKVTRDEAREVLEGMTGPQLTEAKQGLRSYIDDVLANVNAVVSDPNIDAREARKALQDLSTRAAREKITMLLDDPEAANRLFFKLGQASRALELRASVATNSRTFGRMAMDDAVTGATREGLMNTALRGEPLNVAKRAVQGVTGRTPEGERRMADSIYEEITNLLTSLPPDQQIDMLSMMSQAARKAQTPTGPAAPSVLLPGAEVAGQFGR